MDEFEKLGGTARCWPLDTANEDNASRVVNSIHPGFIWTPLVEEIGKEAPEGAESFRFQLDSRHPIGHVGEPGDIAYGVLYLASDEAKFVNGSELVIDSGYEAQ